MIHFKMGPLVALFLLLLNVIGISCSGGNGDYTLEKAKEDFRSKNATESALFYALHREEYPFLDEYYRDSIFPLLSVCDFTETKKIKDILKDTPLGEVCNEYWTDIREELLRNIEKEIKQNAEYQKKLFTEEIFPIIEFELENQMEEDLEDLLDSYSGGLFNYRKLAFLWGKNSDKFEELWYKKIVPKNYVDIIQKYTTSFLDSISFYQQQYLKNVSGRNIKKVDKLPMPQIDLTLSPLILKNVEQFTYNEKMDITTELVKDYAAPAAITLFTGGVGGALYEIGNTAYDVNEVYKDITNPKVSAEEQLTSLCFEEIMASMKDTHLNHYREDVLDVLDRSNVRLFNLIRLSL